MAEILSFGDFRLDREAGALLHDGKPIAIRKKLWDALCFLTENPGRLVSADELQRVLWGRELVGERSLGNLIHELRKVLRDSVATPRYIETVPARGVRFVAAVTSHAGAGAAAFVGRTEELKLLLATSARALAGERQLALITGDAGVGKSALVERFLAALRQDPASHPVAFTGRAVETSGPTDAFLPAFDILDAWAESTQPHAPGIAPLLREHAPSWARQVSWASQSASPTVLTAAEARPERMLRELAVAMEAAAAERLLVLVFEDLHWADPSTLDLIAYLAHRTTRAKLLLMATYRTAHALPTDHPLRRLRLAPRGRSAFLDLQPLQRGEVQECLALALDGDTQTAAILLEEAMRRSAGVPLFVHAIAGLFLDREIVRRQADGWRVSADADFSKLGIPAEVDSLLGERLFSLSHKERKLLEAAAVAGEEFDAAAIAGALGLPVEEADEALRQPRSQSCWISEIGIATWADGTISGRFRFRHALYRDALYQRIPVSRRTRLHRDIARAIERGFATSPSAAIATLAEHFDSGGDFDRAAHYLEQCALRMVSRSAVREAATYFRRALERLLLLADGRERRVREVRIRTGYGLSTALTEGLESPVVAECYTEVDRLRRQITEPEVLFPTLRVFWVFELLRFGYREMERIDEQLTAIASASHDPTYQSLAASMAGTTQCFLGNLKRARQLLETSLSRDDDGTRLPNPHAWLADPRVESRCVLAWVLWLMGEADSSRALLAEARRIAQVGGHEATRALATWFRSSLSQLDGDVGATRDAADELQALAQESGVPALLQIATIVRALASLLEGDPRALEEGLASLTAAEGSPTVVIARAYLLGQLALAYGRRGEATHGLALVDMALARISTNSARVSEADLLRIRGELLEAAGRALEAAAAFKEALEVARAQGARAFELRAAMSQLRLAGKLGKAEAIRRARSYLSSLHRTLAANGRTQDVHHAGNLLA